MFRNRKERKTGSDITLIAPNCEFVGDVHFSGEFIVDGTLKGNIYARWGSESVLRIHENGLVCGSIQVPNIIVNGKVCGEIRADRHIELGAMAEVQGSVHYDVVEMVKGSKVDGLLVHLQDGKQMELEGSKKEAKTDVMPDGMSERKPDENASGKDSEETQPADAVALATGVGNR